MKTLNPTKKASDRRAPIEELRKFVEQILLKAGCDEENAMVATDVFLEADMRGNFMQGVEHVPTMLRNIENGNLSPRAKPRINQDRPTYALINGSRGPGQVAALAAADNVVSNAREFGSAAAGVCNSADLYMLGYYTERIARESLLGIGISSGAPNTHAIGGIKPVLGTNPISVALPGRKDPVLLDMATSAMSMSRVRFAKAFGQQLPNKSAIDFNGIETLDPAAAIEGALSPMAGHKGFALSVIIAMMCGPMTGSGAGEDLSGWGWRESDNTPAGMGHFFVAIDPFSYVKHSAYLDALERFLTFIKTSPKAPGYEEIRIPGERAFELRRESLRSGTVSINRNGWSEIEKMASRFNVALPSSLST